MWTLEDQSSFQIFFVFFLPPSQLWNPCFKITIVRSPECKTDNPICSQTWGSCAHHCENHSFHPVEKGTATHSSIPAWIIPRTEEPGQLQSMGSQSPDTPEKLAQRNRLVQTQENALTTLPEHTSRLLSKPAVHVPQITHLSVIH